MTRSYGEMNDIILEDIIFVKPKIELNELVDFKIQYAYEKCD